MESTFDFLIVLNFKKYYFSILTCFYSLLMFMKPWSTGRIAGLYTACMSFVNRTFTDAFVDLFPNLQSHACLFLSNFMNGDQPWTLSRRI
jgi:hypothetical protein